jgi:hypothetical protein
MKAAGNNRHGHRDATMILMAFAPPNPPVVRAEAARIPWVPPLASELERLLMADAIGPANISHNSGQRIIRVFYASLSGDRGRSIRCSSRGPLELSLRPEPPGALTNR